MGKLLLCIFLLASAVHAGDCPFETHGPGSAMERLKVSLSNFRLTCAPKSASPLEKLFDQLQSAAPDKSEALPRRHARMAALWGTLSDNAEALCRGDENRRKREAAEVASSLASLFIEQEPDPEFAGLGVGLAASVLNQAMDRTMPPAEGGIRTDFSPLNTALSCRLFDAIQQDLKCDGSQNAGKSPVDEALKAMNDTEDSRPQIGTLSGEPAFDTVSAVLNIPVSDPLHHRTTRMVDYLNDASDSLDPAWKARIRELAVGYQTYETSLASGNVERINSARETILQWIEPLDTDGKKAANEVLKAVARHWQKILPSQSGLRHFAAWERDEHLAGKLWEAVKPQTPAALLGILRQPKYTALLANEAVRLSHDAQAPAPADPAQRRRQFEGHIRPLLEHCALLASAYHAEGAARHQEICRPLLCPDVISSLDVKQECRLLADEAQTLSRLRERYMTQGMLCPSDRKPEPPPRRTLFQKAMDALRVGKPAKPADSHAP